MQKLWMAAIALLVAVPAVAQQVYKWVDKDGTVHFTDSPPPDSIRAERKILHGNVQSSAGDTQSVRGVRSNEVDVLYTPEQRKAACEQARANLTTLTNMATVTVDRDGDGQIETLTEEEKAAELKRTEDQITLLCNDKPVS